MRHTLTTLLAAAAALGSLCATPAQAGHCMQCKPTVTATNVPISEADDFFRVLHLQIAGGGDWSVSKPATDLPDDGSGKETWTAEVQYWRMCRTGAPFNFQLGKHGSMWNRWPNSVINLQAYSCGKGVDCDGGTHCGDAW